MKVQDINVAIGAASSDSDNSKGLSIISIPQLTVKGKDKDGIDCEIILTGIKVRV